MPQRMIAFRKAFRCRALKPSTWAGGDQGEGAGNSEMWQKSTGKGGAQRSRGLQRGQDPEGHGPDQGLSQAHLYLALTQHDPPALPPLLRAPGVAAAGSSLL